MIPEEKIQSTALDLEDILIAEREFLMAGRVREAAELSGEKLAALEAFENIFGARTPIAVSAPTRQLILDVIQLSEENAILLNAVRNGVRSLIARFEGPAGDAFVGSYRQGGSQIAFSNATGQYLKRV
ncbi:hypothetical protein HNE_0263 [Hyphomonas neptunium ATCC 15444]|uniref:Flagellar protein FlgN n=2 Tax=Hyphomonas TaxID=85 RepID=Q0C5J9_HYPNA|nr:MULTISPECIES: hypothetical protein [Hyphomonas]ABI78451.1 hypothetical protein HNE_0263 [Hyphomonas neptunium ATCC 15444]KCZ95422.1 hypothetical protein HHI_04680 [Hyphomonas hirschiana VP5]